MSAYAVRLPDDRNARRRRLPDVCRNMPATLDCTHPPARSPATISPAATSRVDETFNVGDKIRLRCSSKVHRYTS